MKILTCLVCLFLLSACGGGRVSSYDNQALSSPYTTNSGGAMIGLYKYPLNLGSRKQPKQLCLNPGMPPVIPPPLVLNSYRPNDIKFRQIMIIDYNNRLNQYNRKMQDYTRCINQR